MKITSLNSPITSRPTFIELTAEGGIDELFLKRLHDALAGKSIIRFDNGVSAQSWDFPAADMKTLAE